MSLDGKCGKSGQTSLILCMMLPVGVVLCMRDQYWVFLPLAAIIATGHHGMLVTMRCRHSTGISAHLPSSPWRRSPIFWGGLSILVIAQPIHPKYVLWGCKSGDLAGCSMLMTLPCWRKSRTTPSWWGVAYHLVSGSCPWKAAWQMVLRYFAQCEVSGEVSVGEHKRRFGTIVKSSRDVCTGPPPAFAGSAHQVNNVP